MSYQMNSAWERGVTLGVAFTLGGTLLGLINIGSDLWADGSIEDWNRAYVAGGVPLVGLVGTIVTYVLGQHAARAEMVSIHGEDAVAAYEKLQSSKK